MALGEKRAGVLALEEGRRFLDNVASKVDGAEYAYDYVEVLKMELMDLRAVPCHCEPLVLTEQSKIMV